MKFFEKNSQLDEMQEKKLLKVESRAFWGMWIALFVAILIQSAMNVPGKQIAAEWIIFIMTCLYMVIETLRNGIWDRHLIPTTGANIVISLLGGACFAVYLAFSTSNTMPEPGPWWLVLVIALTGGLFVAVLIFAFEQLGLVAYRKRKAQLESDDDDESNLNTKEGEK